MSEQPNPQTTAVIDSGLGAVITLLRYYGIGANSVIAQQRNDGAEPAVDHYLRIGLLRHGRGKRNCYTANQRPPIDSKLSSAEKPREMISPF